MTHCPACSLDGPCADARCDARRHACDVCDRRWSSRLAAARCCDQIEDTTD